MNDNLRLKDFGNRIWTFRLEGDECADLDNCDFTIPTDSEDQALIVDNAVRMNWHAESSWNAVSGPSWTNPDGTTPNGVPVPGSNVVIPSGLLSYINHAYSTHTYTK